MTSFKYIVCASIMLCFAAHADDNDDAGVAARGGRMSGQFQNRGGEYRGGEEFHGGEDLERAAPYAHPEARAYENGAEAGAAVSGAAGAAGVAPVEEPPVIIQEPAQNQQQ